MLTFKIPSNEVVLVPPKIGKLQQRLAEIYGQYYILVDEIIIIYTRLRTAMRLSCSGGGACLSFFTGTAVRRGAGLRKTRTGQPQARVNDYPPPARQCTTWRLGERVDRRPSRKLCFARTRAQHALTYIVYTYIYNVGIIIIYFNINAIGKLYTRPVAPRRRKTSVFPCTPYNEHINLSLIYIGAFACACVQPRYVSPRQAPPDDSGCLQDSSNQPRTGTANSFSRNVSKDAAAVDDDAQYTPVT